MAAVEDEVDDRFKDIDIETILSRVQRRPLTFSRKKTVLKAPEFVRRLSGEETVDEGSDLTLQFKVKGVPTPTLRWFKDDEEVSDHPRLSVEEHEDGGCLLTLHAVNKGDEAAYRCRAENSEGSSSCCFFLSVKAKPKSPKRDGKMSPNKRTVSYPTMFSTIVEKVEEEEKAGRETAQAPESPLSHFYDSLTLKSRNAWPSFLGDWAFVNGTHKARGGSTGSYCSSGSEADGGECEAAEGWQSDDVFADSPEKSGQDLEPATPSPVLCLRERSAGAQRVGTVPKDVDRPPEKTPARGVQTLTPGVPATNQKPASPVSTSSTNHLDSAKSTAPKRDSATSTNQKPGPVTPACQKPDSTTTASQKPGKQIASAAEKGEPTGNYEAEKDSGQDLSVPRKPAEGSRLKGLASTLTPLHLKPSVWSPLKVQMAEKADRIKVSYNDSSDSVDGMEVIVDHCSPKQSLPGSHVRMLGKEGERWVQEPAPSSLGREEREATPIPPGRLVQPQMVYSSDPSFPGQSAGSQLSSPEGDATVRQSPSWLGASRQLVGSDVKQDKTDDGILLDVYVSMGLDDSADVSDTRSPADKVSRYQPAAPAPHVQAFSGAPEDIDLAEGESDVDLPLRTPTRRSIVSATTPPCPRHAVSDRRQTFSAISPPSSPTPRASASSASTPGVNTSAPRRSRGMLPCSLRVRAARMQDRRQAREQQVSWQEIGDVLFFVCFLTFVALFFDLPPNQFILLVAVCCLLSFFFHSLRTNWS